MLKISKSDNPRYKPKHPLLMIVGNYGSGKTEVAVNLSIHLRQAGLEVSIADLDLVNAYFRCREPKGLMEEKGIRVVVPPGIRRFADLPIVVPEIRGMVQAEETNNQISIFDVGGDDVGATLLSSLVEPLGSRPYSLLQVINAKRPFTDTVEGCLDMKEAIERASRLSITGLIVNSHLADETTPEIVMEGYALASEVSSSAGIPIEFVTAMAHLANDSAIQALPVPVLQMKRFMLPPWLMEADPTRAKESETKPPVSAW